MDKIPQKGSRASRDLQSVFDNAPNEPIEEMLPRLEIPQKSELPSDVLREIIMPSEDARQVSGWEEDQNGIATPSRSKQFIKWPIDVEESNFYLAFHARTWNRAEEFWGTIRKQEGQNVCWFELVKTPHLPWFSINIIPEKKMADEDYDYIEQFTRRNVPETSRHIIDPIPVDQVMLEYTLSVDQKAYTIVDLGMGFPLSGFFYEKLNSIKARQLTDIMKSAIGAFRQDLQLDYEDFKPRTA